MLSITNILFPTDLSESSDKAFSVAEPFINRFEAKLHILHLISWHGTGIFSRSEYGLPVTEQNRILQRMEEEARTQIHESFGLKPDFYRQLVEESSKSAAEGIVDYASENDIDLIVVGSAGGKEIYRHIIGGTLEKIIASSSVPIFAVGQEADARLDFRKILVAVDLSENTSAVLETAAQYAREFGASLRLVHVVPPQDTTVTGPVGLDPVAAMDPREVQRAELALTEIASGVLGETDFEVVVVAGHPDLQIERESGEGVDLVIVASHGHRGFKRLFLGSTARHTVHHAKCPVLVYNANSLYHDEGEG